MRRKKSAFTFVGVDSFDARRGYKRCRPPGVGVRCGDRPGAVADFWRDRSGQVVVRFFSQGYAYHCLATLKAGDPIPDDQMKEFSDWVADVLFEWVIDGVDDDPEPRGD